MTVARQPQCAQGGPARDGQLQGNKVVTKDFFGDGVFNLNARVRFDKEQGFTVQPVVGHQEFECSKGSVIVALRQFQRPVDQGRALGVGKAGAGRDFDNLLVAALQGAFAFCEINAGAAAVAKHLNLKVACGGQVTFDIDIRVAKGRLRLGPATLPCVGKIGLGRNDPHTATAAASDRLDQHRRAGWQCVEKGGGGVQ